MYLIVGLGNPGKKYAGTKHNMGFDVIDCLVDEYRIPSSGTALKGLYGKGLIGGEKVLLVKPLTFMNASGECVRLRIIIKWIQRQSWWWCMMTFLWNPGRSG